MSALDTRTPQPLRWEHSKTAMRIPIAKFLPLMQQAVADEPERTDLKLQLARALFAADRMAETVEQLRPSLMDDKADPELLYYLGRASSATGDDELAAAALGRACGYGFQRAFAHQAAALIRLERPEAALQVALQGLEHWSSDFESLQVVAKVLLGSGDAKRLWDLCVDLRTRGEWGGWFLTVMASAAAELGLMDEVHALVNPARWFYAASLAVPDDFNGRLAAELLGHRPLTSSHTVKATRGAGLMIDQLQIDSGPLMQELLARIRHVVDVYVDERRFFSLDPIIAHRPRGVNLNAWALAVRDDGHQTWHIHPAGWISGVYYVAAPDIQPSEDAGIIKFGLHPFGSERPRTVLPNWSIRPEPGLLLLFPSHYAHRTLPTCQSEPRICVAFDVCPSKAVPEAH